MFLQTTTKMSEFMTIHPSHCGCIESAVLTGLRQMYQSKGRDKLKRPTKESFHVCSFDDTEEKVAVRFEGK